MAANFLPTTEEIALGFTREITTLGGNLTEQYDDGSRLFLRAVLDGAAEVRPKDRMWPGVALRVTDAIVSVYPYTFRQICTNGAIVANVSGGRAIARVEFETASEFATAALAEIALTIRECAKPEVFGNITEAIQRASVTPAAVQMIQMLTIVSRVSASLRRDLMQLVFAEFKRADDRTFYGIMNAFTATARDTTDPEAKWTLEELGGRVPALLRSLPEVRQQVPSGARDTSAQVEPSSEALECVGS